MRRLSWGVLLFILRYTAATLSLFSTEKPTGTSIEWHKLRVLDGSQNKAFDELCCQLAGAEKVVSGASFRRKAAPDAGIECYWKLHDGSEWGWQAKFFLKFEATDEVLEDVMRVEEERFRKKLGKRKSEALSADLIEYIDFPHDDDFRFDLKIAQRWILQSVFDLGWSVELFGYFDRYLNRYDRGRESHKPERIGKKYQWIAYYEFLARIADNFKMKKDAWAGRNEENYDGCQDGVR